jgi:hypothetical protein
VNHRGRMCVWFEFTKAVDRRNQKCCVPSRRLKYAIVRCANSPFGNETGNSRWREERASFFAEDGSVDRVEMANESHVWLPNRTLMSSLPCELPILYR